jgi:hypothetical protein
MKGHGNYPRNVRVHPIIVILALVVRIHNPGIDRRSVKVGSGVYGS